MCALGNQRKILLHLVFVAQYFKNCLCIDLLTVDNYGRLFYYDHDVGFSPSIYTQNCSLDMFSLSYGQYPHQNFNNVFKTMIRLWYMNGKM